MAYAKINKSGCCEKYGNVQIRVDFFLEENDPRYYDTYVQVPDIPEDFKYPMDPKNFDEQIKQFPLSWQLKSISIIHFMYFAPV